MNITGKFLLVAALTVSANVAFAEKTLKIGVEGAYPPFSEVNKDGEIVGFDIDIANALCAEMKRKCEMKKIAWDGMIPALKGRKIDAIIASMSATEKRKKSIDFTDRYYRIPVKVVRKKGAAVEFNKEGMKGKIIGVQKSTPFSEHLGDLFGDVAEIKRYPSTDEALVDLQAGGVDVVAAESLVLQEGFLNRDVGKNFELFGPDLIDPKYYGEGIAIGIRKNQEELKQAFNAAIKAIRANGKYKEINDKYFDIDVYGK
ncbi:MAG: nickel transporter [Gammaproteobacteria bacterium]|nr:MAG: nickel transporter [Gammaproteobacteria bacterium]